jgi:hypothetical protein
MAVVNRTGHNDPHRYRGLHMTRDNDALGAAPVQTQCKTKLGEPLRPKLGVDGTATATAIVSKLGRNPKTTKMIDTPVDAGASG